MKDVQGIFPARPQGQRHHPLHQVGVALGVELGTTSPLAISLGVRISASRVLAFGGWCRAPGCGRRDHPRACGQGLPWVPRRMLHPNN
jgi:hypothetical protein